MDGTQTISHYLGIIGIGLLISVFALSQLWKGNPFLDKITPNKNIPSKYCLSC